MKARLFLRFTGLTLALVMSLCACSSPQSAVNEKKIENGRFGGIPLDTTTTVSAASAPIYEETSESASESASDTLTPPESAEEETAPVPANEITEQGASETTSETASETSKNTTAATTAATTKASAATTAATTVTTTIATTTTAAVTTTTTAAATAAPVSTGSYRKNTYKALNHSKVKAVWISYIEINNFLLGKNEAAFRTEVGKLYDNCVSMGLNTVYVHVRAYGDAFYYSSLYPFTKYLSGSLGVKTAFDPLKIMVDEAHKRSISFHAWINPMRLCTSADMRNVSTAYKEGEWYNGAQKGTYIVNVNETWFINPAYDEAIKLVGDGVREIVSNYNVDGIHIDDYFYPTTDTSFDSAAFKASGSSSLSAFRIGNCNKLIREIYNATHECGTGVMFGASPQGSMYNNLNVLYADTEAWCKGGYIDYFAPQIYYGFDNQVQPFKTCTDSWCKLVSGTNVKLCPGLALYKIGSEDKWAGASGKNEWINTRTMIKRQIEYLNSRSECSGFALYCYNYLFTDGYRTAAMKEEIANFKPLLTN